MVRDASLRDAPHHEVVQSPGGLPSYGTGRAARNFSQRAGEKTMSVGTIILIILIIALLGGFSGIGGGPFYGTGYYGGGGLGLVIVILLILVLMGRI
jgi:hypothetical protein